MPVFRAPGLADPNVSEVALQAWNERIVDELQRHPPSPILVADPKLIPDGAVSNGVKWPAHPLEPMNCFDEETAAQLCDWGWAGRAELHNEYLEYGLVMRPDQTGRLRPKRFIATTELMEWWQTMAVHDPEHFLGSIEEITGSRPSMQELFNVTTQSWMQLGRPVREARFRQVMIGAGPSQPPQSSLNPMHLLFMVHPINGLDDLIYVVHFGSFPYAVSEGGRRRRARIEEIFDNAGARYLFCRNADPAAANGAYNQAFLSGTEGNPRARKLAFADPLGMYIRAVSTDDLFLNGNPLPDSWNRLSRGSANGTPQRLEFGPDDNDPAFLDEVTITRNPGAPKVTGFQLAKRIEVGPLVVVGTEEPIPPGAFNDIPSVAEGTITCGLETDDRCQRIADFKTAFDNRTPARRGTRGGRVG
ncbi:MULTISPECIES: hypothetical protein [Bradyrhizobium]|nr:MULTISPECIES: hypothetical protein [Bradyrhizobium]MBR1366614.1 hypothetical protein [Bradyrhizobium ottawaense]